MAVKYEEVKQQLKDKSLSDEELLIINETEKHIDDQILLTFDDSAIRINLNIANFNTSPKGTYLRLKDNRRVQMINELTRRYEEAGWIADVEYDDGLDGPNRSGADFWTLRGNNKNKI